MALKFVSKRLPLFLSLLFLCYSSSAFNITQILSEHEEFSTYTNLLGQTKLADDINKRQSVTLLVVENAAFKPFTGQSDDVVKNVMSLHVILDYLDKQKLQNLDKKTALLTTLFQSTGQAKDKQGFLNVTVSGDGQVAFGSAVSGAELNAKLVKQVTSQPYNISILQVSSLIAPPGIPGGSNSTTKTASSSSSSSDESEAPASQEKSETPAASPPNKESETPAASPPNKESPEKSPGQAPKPLASRKSPTPSTADSPDESSPTGAEEPSAAESPSDIAPSDSASSPVGSAPEPSAAGAPGPGADGPAAAAAASIAGVKMCALALIFASTWSLF